MLPPPFLVTSPPKKCPQNILIAQVLSTSQIRGEPLTLPRTVLVCLPVESEGTKSCFPATSRSSQHPVSSLPNYNGPQECLGQVSSYVAYGTRRFWAHDNVSENKKPVFTKSPLFAAKEQWGFSNFLLS